MVPRAGLEPARPRGRGILSPMRLPISPPGRWIGCIWRPGSESNRRTRLCRPLHDHSATRPVDLRFYRKTGAGSTLENEKPRRTEVFRNWSGKRDSNSRPRPWQGRALPTELFPRRRILSVLADLLSSPWAKIFHLLMRGQAARR